jgi:hypothetical protein
MSKWYNPYDDLRPQADCGVQAFLKAAGFSDTLEMERKINRNDDVIYQFRDGSDPMKIISASQYKTSSGYIIVGTIDNQSFTITGTEDGKFKITELIPSGAASRLFNNMPSDSLDQDGKMTDPKGNDSNATPNSTQINLKENMDVCIKQTATQLKAGP